MSPPEMSTMLFNAPSSIFSFSSTQMKFNRSMIFSSPNGMNRNLVQREVIGSMILET